MQQEASAKEGPFPNKGEGNKNEDISERSRLVGDTSVPAPLLLLMRGLQIHPPHPDQSSEIIHSLIHSFSLAHSLTELTFIKLLSTLSPVKWWGVVLVPIPKVHCESKRGPQMDAFNKVPVTGEAQMCCYEEKKETRSPTIRDKPR